MLLRRFQWHLLPDGPVLLQWGLPEHAVQLHRNLRVAVGDGLLLGAVLLRLLGVLRLRSAVGAREYDP